MHSPQEKAGRLLRQAHLPFGPKDPVAIHGRTF